MIREYLRGVTIQLSSVLVGLSCSVSYLPAQDKTNNPAPLKVRVERTLDHFQIARPINIVNAGDGSGRLFIGSQLGEIQVLQSPSSKDEPTGFLDITDRVVYKDNENEEGLLGVAFHPQFKTNGQLFVCYNSATEPHMIFVSRFHRSKTQPEIMDKNSEEVILKIKKPFWNHNGGTILFGPDQYLYLAMGDGGMGFDPLLSAQDPTTVLGKILRIDVDHPSPGQKYSIPADNPFVDVEGARPEIYAFGLRNVWRMSFDRATGDLIAADVGQDLWEEINHIVCGGNYGWSIREGKHPFVNEKLQRAISQPIDPIFEYPTTKNGANRLPAATYIEARRFRNCKAIMSMAIMCPAKYGHSNGTPPKSKSSKTAQSTGMLISPLLPSAKMNKANCISRQPPAVA